MASVDWQFQSTLPVRGATMRFFVVSSALEISIHAPREGSDLTHPEEKGKQEDFNPRSP